MDYIFGSKRTYRICSKDATIKKMLEFKGDIFPKYNVKILKNIYQIFSKIVSKTVISKSKRTIYEYKK